MGIRRRLPDREILAAHPADWRDTATTIGSSREGRKIQALCVGSGDCNVTLIAGCHADEPVGPAMLELLAGYLTSLPLHHRLLQAYKWHIVPQVNPDGDDRNQTWTARTVVVHDHLGTPDRGYDLRAYLEGAVRELPGDDIEFGFPDSADADSTVRPENRCVAEFLAAAAPIRLHGSFHGMGLAPGPWFLLEPDWVDRSRNLRAHLTQQVKRMGYTLFDSERRGEKGFHRIAPGFATRPNSVAMRDFFLERGDEEEARKFRPSSMEFARANGPDALTFVSEMPLFLTPTLAGKKVDHGALQEIRTRLSRAVTAAPADFDRERAALGVAPMPIRDQMLLQIALLEEALTLI